MNYEVKVRHTSDTGNGISVEALVEGVPVAHTFPKRRGYFVEPDEGKPPYVEKLEKKFEDKMKRQGNVAQAALSEEEKKIHNSEFENRVYGKDKSFKEENNQNTDMESPDLEHPEDIRKYLKENMAEGYLSEDEGMNIDEFVDRYEELLNMKQDFQEIIKELQGGKVE